MKALASVLVALCLLPASAYGYTLAPGSLAGSDTIHALDVARDFWHAEPQCPEGISVTTFDGMYGPPPQFGDQSGAAGELATQPGCSIWLNAAWWWPKWANDSAGHTWDEAYCMVLTHAWGHLLGFGHSTDPESVMYPVPRVVPRGCIPAHRVKRHHRASKSRHHS